MIGFTKEFEYETAYEEIPKYWDEICEKYAANVYAGNPPANEYEKALMDNCIGEYGVCIDDECKAGKGKFLYLIAGKYAGGKIPEGMMLYEFPQSEWAIFDCIGAIPNALQSLNTQIFKEWLPGNPNYEISGNIRRSNNRRGNRRSNNRSYSGNTSDKRFNTTYVICNGNGCCKCRNCSIKKEI